MSGLPRELRDLIESGPLAHLSTINADGSPQVSVIWIGLDGDDLVSGHMQWYAKLRNIERDPRVVLSFEAPRAPGVFLNPYAVLHARAAIEPGDDAWNLLDRLTKVYMSPDTDFPAPKGPGYLVRYSVERIGGVGPWVAASALEPDVPFRRRSPRWMVRSSAMNSRHSSGPPAASSSARTRSRFVVGRCCRPHSPSWANTGTSWIDASVRL